MQNINTAEWVAQMEKLFDHLQEAAYIHRETPIYFANYIEKTKSDIEALDVEDERLDVLESFYEFFDDLESLMTDIDVLNGTFDELKEINL